MEKGKKIVFCYEKIDRDGYGFLQNRRWVNLIFLSPFLK